MRPEDTIVALCECGCGQPAPIATFTAKRYGWEAGQPKRFVKGHNARVQSRPKVFRVQWTEDPETGCWNWDLSCNSNGYGQKQFRENGQHRSFVAHRWVWEHLRGPIPVGMELDHLCRNRRCCNPDHLEPVTRSVNIVRGKLGQRKLTPVAVREIRRAPASASDGELAQHFGVTPANIWHVRTRRTWKWVTDDDEA